MERLFLTECPRDAMQGIKEFIPTERKIEYIQALIECEFDVLDMGSFVSPKVIPQMQDTAKVLEKIVLSNTHTKLLTIVLNERGATDACKYDNINYLGMPFSISETFQHRNGNSTINENYVRLQRVNEIAQSNGKELLVYISMAFGNPYGDDWNSDITLKWTEKIAALGIKHIALADTIGSSTPDSIEQIFSAILPILPHVFISAHIHSKPNEWKDKLTSALACGVRRFEGAVKGFGGCPMASDSLTGNMDTLNILAYGKEHGIKTGIHMEKLALAASIADKLFNEFH